jgi:hypothetical protein
MNGFGRQLAGCLAGRALWLMVSLISFTMIVHWA